MEIAQDAWRPNLRQAEMLAAPDHEVLYGGAAGGGKSDALLIDALGLQHAAISRPRYAAVIFRRTYGELAEFERRSLQWYPRIAAGAKYTSTDKRWAFPGGASIEFAYCERYQDALRHQGREYQWIGWDELTQWGSSECYEFLQTRLRTTDAELPCYTRATCNPGGVGHKWVMDRWQIGPEGAATRFRLPNGKWRRFVPARLSDNPHLGDDYRTQLEGQSDMVRRALIDGRWDVLEVPGQIYRAEIEAAWGEKRITAVPADPALPVHTFWDIGIGDATAIWCAQITRSEVRLVDYYEASGEAIPHYVQWLNARGHTYGEDWLPHDAQARELGTGKSIEEVLRSLSRKVRITPRLSVEDGIHALRMLWPRLWIDDRSCARGLECLTNYRREWNDKMGEYKPQPVHDWASHGADAARYLAVALREAKTKTPTKPRAQHAGATAWMS